MKNKLKPSKEIGKGLTAFNDSIKEDIAKRHVVACRLTEEEYQLYLTARGDKKTDSKYLRELIKSDLK